MVENPPAMRDTWVWKIHWRRERLSTPAFLPGEFHGRRRLAGSSMGSMGSKRVGHD